MADHSILAAFLLFPALGVWLFRKFEAHRATILLFLIGWMLLPVTTIKVQGLPDATKVSILAVAAVLGLLFSYHRLRKVPKRPGDLLMATWCLWPFVASGFNGQGFYEGLSHSLVLVQTYGIPYTLGRMFFAEERPLRELCWSLVLVALAYLPLCGLEMFSGPFLHDWLYGFHQHDIWQHRRSGGWRAMVFLQHGLMVAFCLAVGYVVSFGLLEVEPQRRRTLLPIVVTLAVALYFQRTLTATILAFFGAVLLGLTRLTPARPLKATLLLLAPLYLVLRMTVGLPLDSIQHTFAQWVGPKRSHSLLYRLVSENTVIDLERPGHTVLIGFGRGDWRPPNPFNVTKELVTDSVWIRLLGDCGLIGVFLWYACFLVPIAGVFFTGGSQYRFLLAVVLLLYVYDSLLNSMISPIYHICLGAVVSSESAGAESA